MTRDDENQAWHLWTVGGRALKRDLLIALPLLLALVGLPLIAPSVRKNRRQVYQAAGERAVSRGTPAWAGQVADQIESTFPPGHVMPYPVHELLWKLNVRAGRLVEGLRHLAVLVPHDPTFKVPFGSLMLATRMADGTHRRSKDAAAFHTLMGQVRVHAGDEEGASVHWKQALEANPKDVIALNNLAFRLVSPLVPLVGQRPYDPDEQARLVSAQGFAAEAYLRSPRLAEVVDTQGRVLACLGRDREALVLLKRAARELGEDPTRTQLIATLEKRSP